MRRNKTLFNTIAKKAEQSWPDDLGSNPENHPLWVSHLQKTATKWSEELRSEGLLKTADAVQAHADNLAEYIRRYDTPTNQLLGAKNG